MRRSTSIKHRLHKLDSKQTKHLDMGVIRFFIRATTINNPDTASLKPGGTLYASSSQNSLQIVHRTSGNPLGYRRKHEFLLRSPPVTIHASIAVRFRLKYSKSHVS